MVRSRTVRGVLGSAAVAIAMTIGTLHSAAADPATDRTREIHGLALAGGGVVYLGVELGLKHHLVADACRICEPPAFDEAASRALRWDDTKLADHVSTAIGYAGAPLYAIGLVAASSSGSWRRRTDDAIPVLEAGVAIGLLHHAVKFTLGRQRPFVHHAAPGRPADDDDNASLFSGHTGLAFAVATAGGVVAHERGYRVEPFVWGGGFAIAAATGYLRIAADKHWTTDVLIGAVVGVGVGLAVPLLLHRDTLTSPTRVDAATPRIVSFGFAI